MNNLKKKISLVLAVVMISLAILPIISVNAATEYIPVNVTIKKADGTTLNQSTTYTDIKAGDVIKVNAKCDNSIALYWSQNSYFMSEKGFVFNDQGMAILGYGFDLTDVSQATKAADPTSVNITVPNFAPGTTHTLFVQGVGACDYLTQGDITYEATSGWLKIKFTIPTNEQPPVEDPTTIDTTLKNGSTTLSPNATTTIPVGSDLKLNATSNKTVSKVFYKWDSSAAVEIKGSSTVITIPTTFKPGSTHTLQIYAQASDGTTSTIKVYTIRIPEQAPVIDDELIIEPWMKEASELDTLSVSLRNDSEEEDKANKNIFMLDEEVTYYVDYKNGGKDITSEVKLVLELPLNFTVVDAFGGTVNTSDKTITWTFPNGLEEDQSGTKVVVIKYTSLGKSSVKSKVIYPVADIYKNNKVADSSAVINLIFKDEDTEITEDHYPYMVGDKEAPTFRPDDTITRGEGALVLTRIFGMNTSGTIITSVYPDLGETYVEAQRAIVAATSAGLLSGYSDGYYRPNQPMTRAEFMKILAANVELDAEENDVRGLEIKDAEEAIKKYKDPTRQYTVNGTTVSEHWASPYVSLLARINMTSLTEKNKDLRLDEYITRAEVAQLVNFYLLRAPAKITSKTTTSFTDVSRNHKLYADIVEATRSAHTYTLTVEGTEIAQ